MKTERTYYQLIAKKELHDGGPFILLRPGDMMTQDGVPEFSHEDVKKDIARKNFNFPMGYISHSFLDSFEIRRVVEITKEVRESKNISADGYEIIVTTTVHSKYTTLSPEEIESEFNQ